MSLKTGQEKWSGSAAGYVAYAEELSTGSDVASLRYHDRPQTGIVFTHVRGKAAAQLPGLDLERGLTKEQHAELHKGAWGGVQYLKDGYATVWETDERGKPVTAVDPETGKKHKVAAIDPATGKKKMVKAHTAGFDISLSCSKDIIEYCIAHPEDIPLIQACLQAAGDKMMTVGVEEHARLVRVPTKTPIEDRARTTKTQGSATQRQTADGLVWWSTFGHAARPTPESIERGYGADPHLHLHIFLSSMAWKDGRWLTVDEDDLMKTADYRRDVAEVELARLFEANGIKIEYSEPDRKGRMFQTIAGSKPANRRFFSTNHDRAWRIAQDYEAKYNKPMDPKDLAAAMQVTKGTKTAAAKVADHGEAEQWELWHQAMITAGLSVDMPCRGLPVVYPHIDDQIKELHRRLESSEGLNRYCEDEAIFGHDAVLPAVMRAGVGLGLGPEELRTLATDYIDNHLVVVRDANEASARYYTTKTILANEHAIASALDSKAGQGGDAIADEIVSGVIDRQPNVPDSGQIELIRAICSGAQLVHGVGRAGAGKGFALDVAVQAIRAGCPEVEIVVTAVAAKRAGELARDVGADRSGSVESLYQQFLRGWRSGANSVVILDEAALANTFDMAKLVKVIGPKAKLVMIGDEKQGTAIGPAGWYGQELAKRPPVELTEVYRQADPEDRKTLELIRNGHALEALSRLDARGRIHVVETTSDLMPTLRERYGVHRESGRTVTDIAIVHQGSNRELDSYNRVIQLYRAQQGEIDRTESYVVDEASTGRRWTICSGDRIVMNKGVSEGLSKPVRNGQTGTVVRVGADGAVRIRFDGTEARTITIRLKPEIDVVPVGLGYVMSTAKYQGGQAPVVLITPGSPEIASQNSGYSQTTRMVNHVEVLVDRERWDRGEGPIKALGQAWSQEQTKHLASELMAEVNLDDVELEDVPEIGHEIDETERLIDELRREIDERERDTGWELGF